MERWPQGARTVAAVTVHVDGPCVQLGRGSNALGKDSRGMYAIRRGVPRYLRMLDDLGVAATFFCCGHDVARFPALYREIVAAGHEIAAHGYMHEGWDLGEDEPELLRRTHDIIGEATGVAPVGWCSPSGRKSFRTIPTLRRLGYVYDASEKDADEPYLLRRPDGDDPGFVVLPNNTVSLDDWPVYLNGQALAAEMLEMWRDEFAAIHAAEGYLQLTLHPVAGPGSGGPARAAILARFLRELQGHDDVRILTMAELARHCLARPDLWRMAA